MKKKTKKSKRYCQRCLAMDHKKVIATHINENDPYDEEINDNISKVTLCDYHFEQLQNDI